MSPHRAILVSAVLFGCSSENTRHRHHTTPAEAAPQAQRESNFESRRGGSHQGNITCGQRHRYSVEMGANETLRVAFRTTMTGAEPLGEDIAWQWISPANGVLDTNALPIPEPNGPAREAAVEARSTYAGRYVFAVVVEEGAACAHANYSIELR